MKIAIDASRAVKVQKTGVEQYSNALISSWINMHIQDELYFFAPIDPPKEFSSLPKNFRWIKVAGKKLWSQYYLITALKKNKTDILFVPSHIIPFLYFKNSVITIHDVGYMVKPELYHKKETIYQKWTNKYCIEKAKGIIVPSNHTKKEIVKYFKTDPSKIKVIPHGYNQNLFYPKIDNLTYKDIQKPYIYFVGRIESKKNIINLLKSFELLRKESKIKHSLVLAGKDGYGADEIKKEYEKLSSELKKQIYFLGYVDDQTNSNLMRNADIFFFPSYYEGFGFPIIEAMACGIPVVCSNSTSLPEIAGNASILIDPDKPFSMAVALSKIINNKKLHELMIKTGLKRAKFFSWKKCASETIEYIKLINMRN